MQHTSFETGPIFCVRLTLPTYISRGLFGHEPHVASTYATSLLDLVLRPRVQHCAVIFWALFPRALLRSGG